MICNKCGTEMPNDASMCPSCGEEQNADVFSPRSKWAEERYKSEKRGRKKLLSVVALLISAVFIVLSYSMGIVPTWRRYNEKLPPYAAVVGTDGNVSIISTTSKKIITLDEGDEIRDIMLNENEDTLFFIAKKDGKSMLCSRYLSNLIYESNVVAKDVDSYLINNNAKYVAYKTEKGKLLWGETEGKAKHKEIAENVEDFYLSYSGKFIVYTCVQEDVSFIYTFDGENSELVCKGAEIVDLESNLESIYYSFGGGLFIYNTFTKENKCLAVSFREIINIYRKWNTVYYTVVNKSEGTQALMVSKDGETKCITDNLERIEVCHPSNPSVIYREFDGTGYGYNYKLIRDNDFDNIISFNGNNLSDFEFADGNANVVYIDKSGEQSRLVSAHVGNGKIDKHEVLDTDAVLLCGIIGKKPFYAKNFNPGDMTVTLCYAGSTVATKVKLKDASDIDSHMLKPNTFEYYSPDGYRNLPYLAAIPLRSSESFMFYDKEGFISKFDGRSVTPVSEAEADDLYLISGDCILYSTGSGFFMRQNGKNTELDLDVKDFIYIEPYGSKPYQLEK